MGKTVLLLLFVMAIILNAGCSHIDISEDKSWDDIKLEAELKEISKG